MRLRSEISRLLLAGGSVVALDPTLALAQAAGGALEEVVVTATRRAEDIQNVPFAISALTGDDLERKGLVNLDQLSRFVPSLQWVPANTPRNAGVFMRGIGQQGTNQGIEPSVGVFLDGVYLPIPGPLQTNLRDIASVEVLRGPQGTLYGRNTPIGAININTRTPTQEDEASLTASYGNYNDVRLSGFFGGGLGETTAGRLSFWYSDRDGYEDNLATGRDINYADQYGVRGRLQWEPSSTVTGNFIGYYTKMESHVGSPEQLDIPQLATPGFLANSAALGTPLLNDKTGDHKVEEEASGLSTMEIAGASATFDVELGSAGTLTSITAYSWIKDDSADPGWAGLSRDTLDRQGADTTRDGWSQELRLASPSDRALTYVTGIYLYSDDVDYEQFFETAPGANRIFPIPVAPGVIVPMTLNVGDNLTYLFNQKTESYAAFGQLGYRVTDRLNLIGGLRYSYDKKTGDSLVEPDPKSSVLFQRVFFPRNELNDLDYSDDSLTYTATAQYDLSDEVMAYATYATGFKSGGFSGAITTPGTPIEFDPEESSSIEVGIKSTLLDGALRLNVDVYRLDLNDFQDSTTNPVTQSGFIVGNAGDRRAQGLEMDAQWAPIADLTLSGSLAYLDAEYTDYPDGVCYLGQVPDNAAKGSCDYTGKRPYHSPEWSGSLAADYRHALGSENRVVGFGGVNVSYTGEEYTNPNLDPRSRQGSVTLLGARAGIESADGTWRASIYGMNLTDEVYYTATNGLIFAPFIGAAAPGATPPAAFAGANGFVGWYAPPRTYGLELTYNF